MDGSLRRATSFTDYSVLRDYFWTYNDEIVFSQDIIATDEYKMYSMDVTTLKQRNILSLEKVKILMLSRNRQEPDIVTIRMNKRDPAIFDIYRLNVKTGDLKPYLINPGNITEWYPEADGKIRLVASSDGVDRTILYRPDDNTPFKPIIENNFKTSVRPIRLYG